MLRSKRKIQAEDGQPFKYWLRKKSKAAYVFIQCCDCALVHLQEFKPYARYIRVRTWRDQPKTILARKEQRRKTKKNKGTKC